jgi:hypothetical protein
VVIDWNYLAIVHNLVICSIITHLSVRLFGTFGVFTNLNIIDQMGLVRVSCYKQFLTNVTLKNLNIYKCDLNYWILLTNYWSNFLFFTFFSKILAFINLKSFLIIVRELITFQNSKIQSTVCSDYIVDYPL